jgi:hypothetical protein
MGADRKGTRHIKTVSALLDSRRVRTCAGALMELSALADERERLGAELERWVRRHAEIRARLAEIGQKEERLQAYVQVRGGGQGARPLPQAEVPRNVVIRELNY